jgi:hypothetical protein
MPELHFAISFPQSQPRFENFEGTVTTLVGGSVRSQLLQLHLADRDASLDALLLRVGIRRTRLTLDRCSALKTRTDELSKVSINVPSARGAIPLHPVGHQIVTSLNGAYINATFQDPEIGLVRWALETLDALNKCTTA